VGGRREERDSRRGRGRGADAAAAASAAAGRVAIEKPADF